VEFLETSNLVSGVCARTGAGSCIQKVRQGWQETDRGLPREVELTFRNRAQRFGIQIHLRYRLTGDSKWWKGTTENISRSGVLFRGEEFAEPNTPLELSFVLPKEIVGVQPAEVVCRGTVIRSERPKSAGVFPALATTILHYRFIRP